MFVTLQPKKGDIADGKGGWASSAVQFAPNCRALAAKGASGLALPYISVNGALPDPPTDAALQTHP